MEVADGLFDDGADGVGGQCGRHEALGCDDDAGGGDDDGDELGGLPLGGLGDVGSQVPGFDPEVGAHAGDLGAQLVLGGEVGEVGRGGSSGASASGSDTCKARSTW